MELRDAARQGVTAALRPLHYIPSSNARNWLRARLWAAFGAPRRLVPCRLPRRPLVFEPGDTAVIVGAVNPPLIHATVQHVTDRGRVLVFEPAAEARAAIKPAVDTYPNVTVDSRGVWPEDGTVELSSRPDYPGGGRVLDPSIEAELPSLPDPETLTIEVAPLDALLEEYDAQPDVIEVMTNGTEFDVLRSGRNRIQRNFPRYSVRPLDTRPTPNRGRAGSLAWSPSSRTNATGSLTLPSGMPLQNRTPPMATSSRGGPDEEYKTTRLCSSSSVAAHDSSMSSQ